MMYDLNGNMLNDVYSSKGSKLSTAYGAKGNTVYEGFTPKTDYEEAMFETMKACAEDASLETISLIIHTDQHTYLRNNKVFKLLNDMGAFNIVSSCVNLGDVTNYNVSNYEAMQEALSYVPIEKQINIWGNHDTWIGSPDVRTPNADEMVVLNQYFDNSAYPNYHLLNNYGLQYMIDDSKHVKYVVLGGWEYDSNLGRYDYYVISSDGMEKIIQMLSANDGNDIIILSHIQPYKRMRTANLWTHPPVESDDPQGGAGSMSYTVGCVASDVYMDDLIDARKNKTSGEIADSYGNIHSYDFSDCTGNLLCCFAGHEHFDKYAWGNGNIPIYLFDAYAFDNHPIYFVNVNRNNGNLNIWKIDEVPTVYNYTIPFIEQT